jgi:hypothetical protein
LFESLSDPRDVAVSKNAQATLDETLLLSVALGILILEEGKNGLRHSQA